MDRILRESKTFDEILKAFGESIVITDGGNESQLQCVATSFDESARYLSDSSTYEDLSGQEHNSIALQFTWCVEVKKADWTFSNDSIVKFRDIDYNLVSRNETDVSTFKIYLIEKGG